MYMQVCTLSFPKYGFMKRKVKENMERQVAFKQEVARRGPGEDKEDLQARIKEFQGSLYDPRRQIRDHTIIISNFWFKHGPDTNDAWSIDEISMRSTRDAWTMYANFRWRGRMAISLRGPKFINVLRLDWLNDFLICFCITMLLWLPTVTG